MLTTIQDTGRHGFQMYGMPVSGAMDTFSLRLANVLVGNDQSDAALEVTITGPEINFNGEIWFAITGADISAELNGYPVEMNRAVLADDGDILSFGDLQSGCRAYIAFSGGIDVPVVMGSRSTYLRSGTGGFEGRKLKFGDTLKPGRPKRKALRKAFPAAYLSEYKSHQELRITMGAETTRFGDTIYGTFLKAAYDLTPACDRMGYRLSGEPLLPVDGAVEIISAGIAPGTIQVPGDGQPVILMADRPTTGGYNRIASLISADLPLAAQMKPGDSISFAETTVDEAVSLFRQKIRLIEKLLL